MPGCAWVAPSDLKLGSACARHDGAGRHARASDSRCRMGKAARSGSRARGTSVARHVLLADDGSNAAAHARRFALMLTAAPGARLTAVYVRDPLESREEGHGKLAATLAA